jgi:uncharacterized protein YecT (DUF1311 family)
MHTNVRNLVIATIMVACSIFSVPSHADEWKDTPWSEKEMGKCFPSTDAFMRKTFPGLYPKYPEIRIREMGDPKSAYYLAADYTPSKNPTTYILRREKNEHVCLIGYVYAADISDIKFSKRGVLEKIVGWDQNTEIAYKANSKGYLMPSKCLVYLKNEKTGEYSQPLILSCHARLRHVFSEYGGYPSFDCSKARTSVEKIVCADESISILDTILAMNYRNLGVANIGLKHEQLETDQRAWLKRRNNCETHDCISKAYIERIREICTAYPVVSGFAPACNSEEDDYNVLGKYYY